MQLSLADFKVLMGVTDNNSDTLFTFILTDVENVVLDYCHIDTLPPRLITTCYRMAMDLYKKLTEDDGVVSGGGTSTAISTKNASEVTIKEGDSSVTIKKDEGTGTTTGTSTGSAKANGDVLNAILVDYEQHLQHYRKLVW